MQFDVSTLYLAGALFSGFASAVIYLGGGRFSRHNGLRSASFAAASLAGALLLLGLRGAIDQWVTLGLGNTLLAASALLFRFAVDELQGRQERTRGPLFTVGLVWLAEWASLIADTSAPVRAAVGAFGTAAALLLPVPPLVRARQPWAGRIHYVAGAAFVLGALASLARGLAGLADARIAPPAAQQAWNVLFALTMLALVAVCVVAFLVILRQQELAQIAMLDGLTEVFNRRAFMDQTKRVLSLAQRRGLACSMVLVDLDHLNRVNHEHGVRAGDQVLRQFVAQARGVLRQEDVLGRSGGGEFAMLLFATPAAGAQAVARRLQSALHARPPRVGGVSVPLTGSFGVSEWLPGRESDGSDLLRRADQALYEAKARGRNCVVCAAN